jgi:hypothetical protein
MFHPIQGGSTIEVQGLKCNIPPYGWGVHSETAELSKVDVIKRSPVKSEQYWEPPYTADDIADWNEWYEEEKAMQEDDPEYIHPELQKVRQREWHRRLYGVWLWINGQAYYIPGIFYFYLAYWRCLDTDTGLPDYRLIDLEYFYFWLYVYQDPKCFGFIEIRKRRDGKSYRAACILYEVISRSKKAQGAIQSKTRDDAAEFFQNKLVIGFKTLPKFFIPEYDTSKGDTPKEELRFFRTSQKGKSAKVSESKKVPELQSSIFFKDRQAKALDGHRLKIGVFDESGKVEIDVMARHAIVKYCFMDNRRRKTGAMIVTSTVEQIGVKFGFKKLWEQSNQYEREKNGTTKSGLYKFFIPAARSGDYDKYGIPDVDGTLKAIKADREAVADDPDELNAITRKEPLSEKEAFIIAATQCHFSPIAINNQLGELGLMDNYKERGDFMWKNGQRDTEVEWVKNQNGRWEICYLTNEPNRVIRRSDTARPTNSFKYICGVDPVDMDLPKDEKRGSKPAFVIKKRHDVLEPNHAYNNAYVCKYLPKKRPKAASEFYEDLIKTLVYYGCEALYERNKNRLGSYLTERGYADFLMWLPGENEPGVYASTESKGSALELLQEYVKDSVHKVYFDDILEDWLDFDIKDSSPFDISMATLWCEVADKYRTAKRHTGQVRDITDFFKINKIA